MAQGFLPAIARANPKGVVLVGRRLDPLRASEEDFKKINSNTETLVVTADISDAASVDSLFNKIKEIFGHADILMNNAGVNLAHGAAVDQPAAKWWKDFEINGLGAFLLATKFINQVPKDSHATFVQSATSSPYGVYPGMSAYNISKLVNLQLTAYLAAENPNVTSIALHPGVVLTSMSFDAIKRFAKDSPELAGCTAVWLCGEHAKWLSGRFVIANWDVEDLCERKEEVLKDDLLTIDLKGRFGKEQFEG